MAETKQVLVPDIGNFEDVNVIEVLVKAGDTVNAEDGLITLETDKAAMDVPSPFAGVIKEIKVKAGDRVSQGSLILLLEGGTAPDVPTAAISGVAPQILKNNDEAASPVGAGQARDQAVRGHGPLLQKTLPPLQDTVQPSLQNMEASQQPKAHASPAIRRFARELGVDLTQVKGGSAKGRVTKDDVQSFVKAALAQPRGAADSSLQISAMPEIDFAQFGPVETKPLSHIQKISAANLHRNWVSIPHITQFEEADITEMEVFRKQLGTEYAAQGIKITPLAFLLRAVVEALQQFPAFNASLDASGENLILKKYFHIGVAVDTPDGLVVPVLRDVNQKGIVQLAKELADISGRAREKKISATEMQGGCFTISSLGGIGGTAFTPIINAPEVAILGVSRAGVKPVHQYGEFAPRLMLPLSLSYDHRVIDGAAAARFIIYLAKALADVRRLAL